MSQARSLKILITGGGTGGHVLPAISVIEEIKRRELPAEYFWIGSSTKVEREAAERSEIPFAAVSTGKFRRYLDVKTIPDLGRVPLGIWQARKLIRAFGPDVIFSTGGFVSVPAVVAGSRRVPVLTHEQTTTLGLATKLNARFSHRVALSYEATRALANGYAAKVCVTGNPVRLSLLDGDPARAFAAFGFRADLPLVYVTGGARGASPLNTRIEQLLPDLLEHCQVLHQTGPRNQDQDDATRLRRLRSTWPADLQARYHVTEFVGAELPDVYAAASLIVARAGAGTIAELALIGNPSILIPLPNTSGDEQVVNARMLGDAGAAVVIPQPEATPERLRREILDLLADEPKLRSMSAAAKSLGRPDAAARLVDELLRLAGR
jgi:UDP-N-acetylglucosamine--N-acetylmuramyl-(pentapeptide) pyrophosphoryl-undecaprenol N-acetylglucosamine transferase